MFVIVCLGVELREELLNLSDASFILYIHLSG